MAPKKKGNKSKGHTKAANFRSIIAKSGKLSKTNLHALFSSPRLWTALSPAQQLSIITSMHLSPQKKGSGYECPWITTEETQKTDGMAEARLDISKHLDRFREHLVEGRFEPKWMRESAEVGMKRERGDYDGLWSVEVDGEGWIDEAARERVDEVRRKRVERKERLEE